MKKYILKICDQDICVIFGNDIEFLDDMLLVFLDNKLVGSFKIDLDSVQVFESEVE